MTNKNQKDFLQLGSLSKSWPQDLRAGLVIFLIALPLSIGIALASGAPAMAGLWSAIVGGILGSFLCGGHVMINGPAAGLIVVVLDSVQALGWQKTLAAIFFAGLIQVGLGLMKAGRLAASVPVNVLHGMLASIGITIIVKQIYVLSGVAPTAKGIIPQMMAIPQALSQANWIILFVGLCCLIAVIGLNLQKSKWLKWLPAPLAAVVLGIVFDKVFDLEHLHTLSFLSHNFEVGDKFLLHVPNSILGSFQGPDFSALSSFEFWKMTLTISLVASIESVLSGYAVDRIDPLKRRSDLSYDLVAKGLCNSLLGLIGGLPIITEIVRSSANITNGAKTRWANFVHGSMILLFVAAVPGLLNLIPLAAFAAILIVVGFRLAHPHNFTHAKEIGWDQLLLFVATLVTILFTDILIGVFAGLVLKVVLNGVRSRSLAGLFRPRIAISESTDSAHVEWTSPAVFLTVSKADKVLESLAQPTVTLDLTRADFVDHTFIDFLQVKADMLKASNRELKVLYSRRHAPTSSHPLSSRRLRDERAGA